ncbi:MAG: DUF3073 domain-containing protein [Actinomycetaceae bacterium]|nr:DUF3073 domain-containing protein [Actinomycetaceae bacterium]
MGRGRQKAKQRKVARKLKYFSAETDYDALQRELAAQRGESSEPSWSEDSAEDADTYDDQYADYAQLEDKYADMYADQDDWEEWAAASK